MAQASSHKPPALRWYVCYVADDPRENRDFVSRRELQAFVGADVRITSRNDSGDFAEGDDSVDIVDEAALGIVTGLTFRLAARA